MSQHTWNDRSNWVSPCCNAPEKSYRAMDGGSSHCSKCDKTFHYCVAVNQFTHTTPLMCCGNLRAAKDIIDSEEKSF